MAKQTNNQEAPVKRKPSKEAMAIVAAMDALGYTQAKLAQELEVTTQVMWQWVSGHRPVPDTHAYKLAEVLQIKDPATICKKLVKLREKGVAVMPTGDKELPDGRREDLAIARLENDIHAINLMLSSLVGSMRLHRPTEAAELAASMRKRLPRKYLDKGLLAKLIAALEKPEKP